MSTLRYRRILLKLGGEALASEKGFGIDPDQADNVAGKIRQLRDLGAEIAIVIGAGNLWRGTDGLAHGMERATADHMGMLATVMNALALADALLRAGVEPRVQTAIEMRAVAEPYIRGRAIRHMEKGRTVLLGAGTGNPYFTTDTAAALRAMEINAEVLIKATKVDGVYDKDPKVYPDARRFEHLTYIEALNMRVGVMDSTALTLCMDNDLPIVVLDLWQPGSLELAALGQPVGTLISP
ncbi:MAG: UMP kinase [Chloroflexi bacterium HGW-Chloroflexi-1]|nr:MAG: UMP kinase [Chloroflexi bacterium HGW-Chloroflexi-1]